jgi:hypothetical protein
VAETRAGRRAERVTPGRADAGIEGELPGGDGTGGRRRTGQPQRGEQPLDRVGLVTAPRIRRGPPQRGQTRTWIANTRRRSWAQGQRRGTSAAAARASAGDGFGTMAARQRGAEHPPRAAAARTDQDLKREHAAEQRRPRQNLHSALDYLSPMAYEQRTLVPARDAKALHRPRNWGNSSGRAAAISATRGVVAALGVSACVIGQSCR